MNKLINKVDLINYIDNIFIDYKEDARRYKNQGNAIGSAINRKAKSTCSRIKAYINQMPTVEVEVEGA